MQQLPASIRGRPQVVTDGHQSKLYRVLDAVMSFFALEDFPRAIRFALDGFARDPKNEAAEAVVASASLQCVSVLHPHLDQIFHLGVNGSSYYGTWPWRESGRQALDFLQGVLESDGHSEAERLRAWQALLETRDETCLHYAITVAPRIPLHSDPSLYFAQVGLEGHGDAFRPLDPKTVFHLRFAEGHFDDAERPLWLHTFHPTWRLDADSSALMNFGGDLPGDVRCDACGGGLHHLITLDPVPVGIGVTGLSRLCLATCLSCLGWEQEELFYRHDEEGSPAQIGHSGGSVTPQFPVGPLKGCQVRLAPTPNRWHWQDCGLSNSRENLNRVGGPPCWVQSSQYPACPMCQETMQFLMQLDSDLPMADGGEWLWGSGGIGYVFWCDACRVSGYLWQCT